MTEFASSSAVILEPKPLNDLFVEQRLAPSWTGAVLDQHMTIAGRSRDPQRYVGVTCHPFAGQPHLLASESGLFTAHESGRRHSSTRYSAALPRTGWSVAIGIPAAEVEGPISTYPAATDRRG
jgi:hypothetical protein